MVRVICLLFFISVTIAQPSKAQEGTFRYSAKATSEKVLTAEEKAKAEMRQQITDMAFKELSAKKALRRASEELQRAQKEAAIFASFWPETTGDLSQQSFSEQQQKLEHLQDSLDITPGKMTLQEWLSPENVRSRVELWSSVKREAEEISFVLKSFVAALARHQDAVTEFDAWQIEASQLAQHPGVDKLALNAAFEAQDKAKELWLNADSSYANALSSNSQLLLFIRQTAESSPTLLLLSEARESVSTLLQEANEAKDIDPAQERISFWIILIALAVFLALIACYFRLK
jgi:hypothetical protein